MIEKWKNYCNGSSLLAILTLGEIGIWLIVMILSLAGRLLHFYVPITEWLTLPSYFPTFLTRPWTLLTYMAVHFEALHVLFNVLWLYWFGKIMLLRLADRQLATAFFGGGIAGGVLFLAAAALGYGSGWLCGCSAAVIAVMSVAAIMLPDFEVNLLLIGEIKLKWVAIVCCILTFLGGGGNQAAHLGGAIWGLSLGLMLRNGTDPAAWLAKVIPHRKYTKENGASRSADRMVRVLNDRRADLERLDALLDKIKISGYGSLSRKERKELNELSQRLK